MPEKSKKILIFSTAYRPFVGGSEIAIEQIASRLPDMFFDIITPRYRNDLHDERQTNNTIHRVGFGSFLDKYLFPILGFFRGYQLTAAGRYHASHAYQASYGASAAWLLRWFKPIPFILTLQEGKDLNAQSLAVRFFRRLIIARADYATAISTYLERFIHSVRPSLLVNVIPNGVDIELFTEKVSDEEQLKLKQQLGIPFGISVLISVSRLIQKNGIDNLISAFAELKQSRPAVLILAGAGPLREDLIRLAENLGVKNDIRWVGEIVYDHLPRYLAVADAFVRPSYSEGLGNAFLEAMAAGVPVVGSDVGGIPDFLKDRETGMVCDPHSPSDIVRAIKIVFEDEPLRSHIISTARILVSQRYHWNQVATAMRSVYDHVS